MRKSVLILIALFSCSCLSLSLGGESKKISDELLQVRMAYYARLLEKNGCSMKKTTDDLISKEGLDATEANRRVLRAWVFSTCKGE